MTTETIIMMAILLIILLETSYMLYRMQRKQLRNNNTSVYVDTSVLMDGRILPIAETGFITAELVIPRSVIGELQLLADGSDHEKRARARFGLDLAQKLRECESVTVTLLQDGSVAKEGVDERLLNLAKKNGGMICTIDYNLNKVAQVEGINVLNVNELAKNVRLSHLPGEVIQLAITQKGQDNHQGVGHLEDGTMVVVENGNKYIGKTVAVEFIRALQTDAGRMMFAKLAAAPSADDKSKQQPAGRRHVVKKAGVLKKKQSTTKETAVQQPVKQVKSASVKPQRATEQQNDGQRRNKQAQPHKQQRRKKPTSRNTEDRLLDLVEGQSDA
ncbi:MAG: PIN/TRAM domain-containing protein [Candidatus Saccharimonadales bacterium]